RDSDFGATGPSLLILGPAGTTARRRAGGGEEAGDHAAGTCRPMTTTATARAPARLRATAADWALAPAAQVSASRKTAAPAARRPARNRPPSRDRAQGSPPGRGCMLTQGSAR